MEQYKHIARVMVQAVFLHHVKIAMIQAQMSIGSFNHRYNGVGEELENWGFSYGTLRLLANNR